MLRGSNSTPWDQDSIVVHNTSHPSHYHSLCAASRDMRNAQVGNLHHLSCSPVLHSPLFLCKLGSSCSLYGVHLSLAPLLNFSHEGLLLLPQLLLLCVLPARDSGMALATPVRPTPGTMSMLAAPNMLMEGSVGLTGACMSYETVMCGVV